MHNFMALDLELNQAGVPKIIQVGVCVGNLRTGEILETAGFYVNPHEALTPFIIDLTGITQEQVDGGGTIVDAYNGMRALAAKYNAQTQGRVLTWGQGDVHEFKEELHKSFVYNGTEQIDSGEFFGRRYIDVKTLHQMWMFSQNKSMQGGLAKSMTKLGLAFDGRKHQAPDDAKNTFRIGAALLKKFRA